MYFWQILKILPHFLFINRESQIIKILSLRLFFYDEEMQLLTANC